MKCKFNLFSFPGNTFFFLYLQMILVVKQIYNIELEFKVRKPLFSVDLQTFEYYYQENVS